MRFMQHRCACISMTVICCLLLVGSLLFAARYQTADTSSSEECIRCHVSTYNQGITSSYVHLPFFERQCVACHLAKGASRVVVKGESGISIVTGTLASQEILWRKSMIYSNEAVRTLDPVARLPGLEVGTTYRFRFAVSPTPQLDSETARKSLWIVLRPDELDKSNPSITSDGELKLAVSGLEVIKSATLTCNDKLVSVSWPKITPLYSWVEIQRMEGVSIENSPAALEASIQEGATADGHPMLIGKEDLSINACYRCHPESTLGTSHPVRLYGGHDVRIPDDLPTVDGMLTCVTCHDPHGAAGKMLVREAIKTKLCVACHFKYKNRSPSTMFD